jgi:hypothetical protein
LRIFRASVATRKGIDAGACGSSIRAEIRRAWRKNYRGKIPAARNQRRQPRSNTMNKMLYSPFSNFFQIAYVTTDFDRCLEVFRERYGIGSFFEIRNGEMETNPGARAQIHVGFAWAGDVQIEIIEPLGGADAIYRDALPAGDGFAMRFHHICQRVESEQAFEELLQLIAKNDLKIAGRGEHEGMVRYLYLDERAELGHYLEHTYHTPAGEKMFEQVPRY